MSRWNEAPYPRDQILLFHQRLEDRISDDHTVRLLVEILDGFDWSSWERHYVLVSGQPPIHPKIMAGAIIYGLTHGIRSSRRLEWACGNAIDFMWLVEGRTIDHSTFCDFRTRFKRELKDLFRQIGRLAMHLGLIRLNQVHLDGTRVKANSSPHATAPAKTLEERLRVLDEQIDKMLAEAGEVDQHHKDLFGDSLSGNTLPAELSDLKKRQERLRQAFEAARKADAKRGKSKKSAKVPVADPDSAIMPNKEGGYAPNFNPLAAVDGESGMIVDADVLNEINEPGAVIPTVERIEANFGQKPRQLVADTGFSTGGNLSALADREIEALMPVESVWLPAENPSDRSDPTHPVPEEDWVKLPRRPRTKKLDRAGPMGRKLSFWHCKTKSRDTCDDSKYRVYRCHSCEGCGLAKDCLAGNAKLRTVSHDQHESARQAAASRLRTESGKKAYARRAHLAETPNAVIKQVMGLRQFLLRGLDKVRTEWLWACTAFNIKKLISIIAKVRADSALKPT
ncbi:MAG: IS1182 family transposase [Planctomycetota bacterium]